MKKFSFIYTLASVLMMGAVALSGLTSCSSSDDAVADVKPDVKPETKYVYQISIPAGFASNEEGTRAWNLSTNKAYFDEEEVVHVYRYDEALGTYTCLTGTLKPDDISTTGESCTLVGELTSSTSIDDGDVLYLMYNMTNPGSSEDGCYFNYDSDGYSDYSILDGATAKIQVTSYQYNKLTPKGTYVITINEETEKYEERFENTNIATFTNAQSMFRLNFQFKDTGGNILPSVTLRSLIVACPSVASEYYPLMPIEDQEDGNGPWHLESNIAINYGNSGKSCTSRIVGDGGVDEVVGTDIYLALCFYEPESARIEGGDKLIFVAQDTDGNYYRGEKACPKDEDKKPIGFKNGKYYLSTSRTPIVMTQYYTLAPYVKTGSASDAMSLVNNLPFEATQNYDGEYTGCGLFSKIGGANVNYRFTIGSGSGTTYNVELDGLVSLSNVTGNPFIKCNGNLVLNVMGDVYIYCNHTNSNSDLNSKYCIESTGTLTLKGDGRLILITRSAGLKVGDTPYEEDDVSGIICGKDGYHLKCTKTTNPNLSGTHTWTYEFVKNS